MSSWTDRLNKAFPGGEEDVGLAVAAELERRVKERCGIEIKVHYCHNFGVPAYQGFVFVCCNGEFPSYFVRAAFIGDMLLSLSIIPSAEDGRKMFYDLAQEFYGREGQILL